MQNWWKFDPYYGNLILIMEPLESELRWKQIAKITGSISFRSGPTVIFSGECRKSHVCQNMQEHIET